MLKLGYKPTHNWEFRVKAGIVLTHCFVSGLGVKDSLVFTLTCLGWFQFRILFIYGIHIDVYFVHYLLMQQPLQSVRIVEKGGRKALTNIQPPVRVTTSHQSPHQICKHHVCSNPEKEKASNKPKTKPRNQLKPINSVNIYYSPIKSLLLLRYFVLS